MRNSPFPAQNNRLDTHSILDWQPPRVKFLSGANVQDKNLKRGREIRLECARAHYY